MPVSGRWNAWQRKLARAQGAKKYNKGPTGRSNGPTPAGLELTRLQALGSQRLSAVKWRMFRTVEARSAPGLKAGDLATSARGCAGPCRWGLWRQTLPKARGGNSPDPPRRPTIVSTAKLGISFLTELCSYLHSCVWHLLLGART
ncbi:uncharacterized protein LOC112206368 isoform X1 [Pan troglodytes]|uniref:uncharacterized protein LOC112206368 isoform X1 n=1 Tax=Pan troglodytes TaxID=9598 RepID=UPI000D09A686